jgi:CheY-like chemotaxis protein
MLNQTGCCNSENNPAPRGSISQLYATGAGQTSPSGIDGYVVPTLDKVSDYAKPEGRVQVTVGGKAAEILYAGAAPHFVAGLMAVNFRIPMDAPIGNTIPVVLTVGNVSSPEQVTMAVRSERQRVLVIERREAGRDRDMTALPLQGFEVEVAENDEDARMLAARQPFDVVVSDLPGGSSTQTRVETLRLIQGTGPQLRIAAIVPVLSSYNLRSADLIGAQMIFAGHPDSKQAAERLRQLLRPMPIDYASPIERGPLSPPGERKDR